MSGSTQTAYVAQSFTLEPYAYVTGSPTADAAGASTLTSSLPAWLGESTQFPFSGSGVLTGTPTVTGSWVVTMDINNAYSGTGFYSFQVSLPHRVPVQHNLARDRVGVHAGGRQRHLYTTQLYASNGQPPYTYSSSALPNDLSMAASGQLLGVPLSAFYSTSVSVSITDAAGCPGTASISLNVSCPAVGFGPTSITTATSPLPGNRTLTPSSTYPYSGVLYAPPVRRR